MPLKVVVLDSYYYRETDIYSKLLGDSSKNTVVIYVSSQVTSNRPESLNVQIFFRATRFYEVFGPVPAEAFRRAISILEEILGDTRYKCVFNDRDFKIQEDIDTFFPYVGARLQNIKRDSLEIGVLIRDIEKALDEL